MPRFPSLEHAPAETLRVLRDRLQRNLGHERLNLGPGSDAPELRDEDMLRLLQSLEIDFARDAGEIASAYEAALPNDRSEPSFEQRVADGWVRIVWGRIRIPREVNFALGRSNRKLGAFKTVLERQYQERIRVARPDRLPAELLEIGQALEASSMDPRQLNCRSPTWVAARLWDRYASGNDAADLRRWVDLWNLLSPQDFVPGKVWGGNDSERFRQTSLHLLETDPALEGWRETRDRFVRELAVIHDRAPAATQSLLPPLPETLVDRIQWLEDNRVVRSSHESWMDSDDLLLLLSLLVADLDASVVSTSLRNIAPKIIDLAVSRPDVLFYLTQILFGRPRLLSDLLLDPRTAALSCWLISQWRIGTSAYDREVVAGGEERGRIEAFEDGVSVLGWWLATEASVPAEAGALLASLHRKASAGFIDDSGDQEPLRMALRKALVDQSAETLKTMVDALLTQGDPLRRVGSRFAAALEIIAIGEIADQVDGIGIVNTYVDSLTKDFLNPSVERIGVQSATSLLAVASQRPELREQFLRPVDIGTELGKSNEPDANPYTVRNNTAGTLRAHIRILCRALVGHAGSVPDDLAGALVDAVRSGAISHQEKSRVAAFAPRYERMPYGAERDRPIAADLAAALWALPDEKRKTLLAAILEMDEPMALAQLLPIAPPAARPEIGRRIEALPPTEAGSIQSLPEVQARIDELLSAGATEAAARFIEEEERLETLGKVQGRAVARFRSRVRLLFARQQWDEILHARAPPDLNPIEKNDAEEVLQLYRGLTFLVRPDQRDPAAAEAIFDDLQKRRPNVVEYAVNKIAARIGALLPTDLFGRLKRKAVPLARQVLAECDELAEKSILDRSNRRTLAANQAVLHLALGEPDRALTLLPVAAFEAIDERIQAYRAVALHRLSRSEEAIGLLNAAKNIFGSTPMLDAAWDQIREGVPFKGSAAIATGDDPVVRVREAYLSLHLLDPIQQAQVLNIGRDPLSGFLIDHVRGAAASVMALVPAMNVIALDQREDDINLLIRQLLLSRLEFLRWSASDQTKGGFTPEQNPGERDVIIERGTTILTVIEALIADNPIDWLTVQDNLRRHFQKLLAYAPCRLFFHLTYIYDQDVRGFLAELKTIAAKDAPTGYTFSGITEIELTDTRPPGFVAEYGDGQGTLQVVFLILNMGQGLLRAAAKASERQKKTSGSGPSKGQT